MKNIFILFFFFSIQQNFSQAEDVVTGVGSPSALFFYDSELYIGEWNGRKLSKIDINDNSATPTDVIQDVYGIFGVQLSGNILYFSGVNENRIYSVDITNTLPLNPTIVYAGLTNPYGLALNGNDLYVAVFNEDKIVKIDISESNPIPTDVITELSSPSGLLLLGNELYISETDANKISKIDITSSNPSTVDVVTDLDIPYGMVINGYELYIAEFGANKVSGINLNDALPTQTFDVVTDLNNPTNLNYHNGELFIAEYGGNKVSKVAISTLSTDEFSDVKEMTVYPNPTEDHLEIYNLREVSTYQIFNSLGQTVDSGTILPNERIQLGRLNRGIYLLRLGNSTSIKFVIE